MVILGAGGFAKEVLQVVEQNVSSENIVFYDDVSENLPALLFDQYPILRSQNDLANYFQNQDSRFIIGIGNGKSREKIAQMATNNGGELISVIDISTQIGKYAEIGKGATILGNSSISNSASIGKAPLIYYNAVITHDCIIGNYVELSPGATILGNVRIGDYAQIGANATVLPNITIGNNCIVGAGAVVTKDVPENSIVAGVPARIIKSIS